MKKEGWERKAQISVFIIVAIVLIAGGGLGYYLIKSNSSNSASKDFFSRAEIKPTMDSIKSSIIYCNDISATGSLEKIGIQGGYSSKPGKSFDLGWAFIPYYYYEGSFLMPDKTVVEKELVKEYEKEFLDCFKGVNATDFVIKHGSSTSKVSIKPGEVLFNMDMPISISKDGNTMTVQMKDDPITQKSKLYEILDIGKYITNSNKNSSKLLCVTCVADMAVQKNLYVSTFDIKDNSVLVLIMDNSASTTGPYYFEFLEKYNQKEMETRQIPAFIPMPSAV